MQSVITEVEAYRGSDDPASHAFRKTPRAQYMFDEPGRMYVYLIYGMHVCVNIVTEQASRPGAVLIRSVLLDDKYIQGPGRVSKALGIDMSFQGYDLCQGDVCCICDQWLKPDIKCAARIGIKKAQDKCWRFYY